MKRARAITKPQIIHRVMDECGLSYVQASKVHDCLVSLVEDAVTNLERIRIGHVGTLSPKIVSGKTVAMNFTRDKTGVRKSQRFFFTDERVRFAFKLHRSFLNKAEFTPHT